MKKIALGMVGFLVLAGAIGYLTTAGGGGSFDVARVREEAVPASGPASAPSMKAPSDVSIGGEGDALLPLGGVDQERATAAGAAGEPSSLGSIGGTGLPRIGPEIVKTASLTVEVKRDGFAQAFDQASLVAQKYDGFVVDSSTQGEKSRSGSLLIRVPEASFDLAMSDLRGLGEVERQAVSGQDVTSEFVDLNARLRTWQAQERVLLRLMNKANTIGETMTIQRELQQVQFNIEDIQGQLRMLRDQTSLATISLTMHEPGVATGNGPKPKPSLSEAWSKALAGFLGVIYTVVVGLGYLIPIAALAALGWLGYRRVTRSKAAGAPARS